MPKRRIILKFHLFGKKISLPSQKILITTLSFPTSKRPLPLSLPVSPSVSQSLRVSPPKIHLCPCGSHPLRVSLSLSEFFFKKYFSHFQLTTKNFQKKLRKNLQDKKNAVPLHPQMRQNTVSKQETTRTLT